MNQAESAGPSEDRHRYRWANRIAAVLGVAIGVASCLALILEGVPSDGGVTLNTATKAHSTTSSGCRKSCDKPKSTETETTVKTSSPAEAGGQSVLERALNNGAGVTFIRVIFALFTALATALVVRRIIVAWVDGRGHGHSGTTAEATPPKPGAPSGEAAPTEKEESIVSTGSHDARTEEDAEDAGAVAEPGPRLKNKHFEF